MSEITRLTGKFSAIKLWLPGLVGLGIFALALFVLHRQLNAIVYADVVAYWRQMPLATALRAVGFTALSYGLLSCYDFLGMKYAGSPLPWRRTASTAFSAFAIGNTVGLPALSGGAIRYRAYSAAGLSIPQIGSVIIFCTSTYLLGSGVLLGATFLLAPVTSLQHLGVASLWVRLGGAGLLTVVLAYLLWLRLPDKTLPLGRWHFTPPQFKLGVAQVGLGCAELCACAVVMYLLLPGESQLGFLPFLGIFILALNAGLFSGVPGGLGVFESAMLLLMPAVPAAGLLGALLAFRLIYYLLPMAASVLLLGSQEVWLRRRQVSAAAHKGQHLLAQAAPQILSATAFLAGAVLLVSGSLPAVVSRLQLINSVLPLPLIETSQMLGSAVGLVLLILARGLHQRLQGAYVITLWALALGVLLSLTKGFDYEEAIILGGIAWLLWSARAEFYRRASLLDQPLSGGWLFSVFLVVGGAIWLGLFVNRHVEYSSELWWRFAITSDAPRMLRASMAAVIALAGFGLLRLLRPGLAASSSADIGDLDKARGVLLQSNRSEANVALSGDKRFLFSSGGDAFIMFQVDGRSGIALGDPVGSPAARSELTWAFREFCDKQDLRCVFYQVSAEHLPLYIDLGLAFLKLGEEARVALAGFSLQGSQRAALRQAHNRCLRDGASFEIVPKAALEPLLPEFRRVSDTWLADKAVAEKGFSVGAFSEDYLRLFDVAVVRVAGEITAFANLWCSGDGQELSIDLMRHLDTAPKGVMDYLFIELMLWGQAHGFQWFNLGMAPLSGLERNNLAPVWHKFGNTLFRFGEHFYNFEGLRQYKQKFDPQWEPRYLATPGGLAVPGVLIDVTTLISGGVRGVFSR